MRHGLDWAALSIGLTLVSSREYRLPHMRLSMLLHDVSLCSAFMMVVKSYEEEFSRAYGSHSLPS